nr:MAG TPA: hypothetical protein [Myoviridae sp. ct3tv2]DAR21237.1 MAG TPA: hypothetical protein [Caudoviricetes sp.]
MKKYAIWALIAWFAMQIFSNMSGIDFDMEYDPESENYDYVRDSDRGENRNNYYDARESGHENYYRPAGDVHEDYYRGRSSRTGRFVHRGR